MFKRVVLFADVLLLTDDKLLSRLVELDTLVVDKLLFKLVFKVLFKLELEDADILLLKVVVVLFPKVLVLLEYLYF